MDSFSFWIAVVMDRSMYQDKWTENLWFSLRDKDRFLRRFKQSPPPQNFTGFQELGNIIIKFWILEVSIYIYPVLLKSAFIFSTKSKWKSYGSTPSDKFINASFLWLLNLSLSGSQKGEKANTICFLSLAMYTKTLHFSAKD